MINFFKQLLLFVTVNIAGGLFKYFFLIINIIPLGLYYFFGFPAENLIMYFILEAIAYCLINIIYIKLLDLPVSFVRVLLVILSLSLIMLSTYFIPLWNKDELSDGRIAFWNYAALLFSFYTINFFFVGDKFYNWEEYLLKRNVILKFGILAFVVISGTLLNHYMKNEIAYLISMIAAKSLFDLLILQKPQAA
jgi:hypothetical protein